MRTFLGLEPPRGGRRRSVNPTISSVRRIEIALVGLLAVIVVGTVGYLVLGFTPLEALYQTVTTVSTVGFREVQPLTRPARSSRSVLIIVGVGHRALQPRRARRGLHRGTPPPAPGEAPHGHGHRRAARPRHHLRPRPGGPRGRPDSARRGRRGRASTATRAGWSGCRRRPTWSATSPGTRCCAGPGIDAPAPWSRARDRRRHRLPDALGARDARPTSSSSPAPGPATRRRRCCSPGPPVRSTRR